MLSFQPRLGRTLFDLSRMYRTLHQEKSATIAKKDRLSSEWFRHRLKLVSDYQEAIKITISIGKSLGDSFAWTFYRDERQYLEEHYKHHRQLQSPPGIGGEGELGFLDAFGIVNGHIALYHGLTTFLRLGDFSFVNLKKNRSLTAIVELKTVQLSDTGMKNHISVIGPVEEAMHLFGDLVDPNAESDTEPLALPLNMSARLNKQTTSIGKSFDVHTPDEQLLIDTDHNYSKLNALWKSMRASCATYLRADDGLLLAGLKSKQSKLSSKLLKKSDYDFPTVFEGLPEEIKRMSLKSSEHNQLIVGQLQAPTPNYYLEQNAIPVFWWPLDLDLIEAILFYDAQILTFQNPAYVAEKLVSNGFDVESREGQQGLRVSKKKRDGGALWLEGFHHFLGMVSRQSWTEDSVVQTVVSITERIEESGIPLAGGVKLDIVQDLG